MIKYSQDFRRIPFWYKNRRMKALQRETIAKQVASTNISDSDTKGTTGSTVELSKVDIQVAVSVDQDMEPYSIISDKESLNVSCPHSQKHDQLIKASIAHFIPFLQNFQNVYGLIHSMF